MTAIDYSADHASAYTDLLGAGAPVTFTLAQQGAYNPATDTTTPAADLVVTGVAVEMKGSLYAYQALGLIVSQARTLFVVGTNYGDLPPLDSTVEWDSTAYTVKNVRPIGPSGAAIGATVIVTIP